jgi:hypothetical protein
VHGPFISLSGPRGARNQRRGGAFQDLGEPEEQGDEDEDRAPADPGMMRNLRYKRREQPHAETKTCTSEHKITLIDIMY